MDTTPLCPNCGKPLPANAPKGLCPECVMQAGFPTGTQPGPGEEGKKSRFIPPPVEALAPLFPQLQILELIGRGGMGAVYRARQPQLDRIVALKILPSHSASDPGFAERFTREARALAKLSHPHIVGVHEFGQAGSFHYFVMEFVDGMNLRQLEQVGRLTPAQALQIIPQICEALQFAHDEGVVHRDIKPENILMDKRGRVKIADFGIAKIIGQEGDFSLTGAQDIMGTPHYMAPEQIEKPREVDHRADIYSLGVVFYEMLTGELPLGKFQSPSEKVQVDVRLDTVVLQALRKEPERRYQQASEVKKDVDTIASGPGSLPPRIVPPPPASPAPQPGNEPSSYTILPTFLLAFFLGPFGVHRFYVGKIGTGILQLGTLGGCGVWAFIDWILIVCGAFTDGQGRRITELVHPQPGATAAQHAIKYTVGIVIANLAIVAAVFGLIVYFTFVIKKVALSQFGLPRVTATRVYGSGRIITATPVLDRPFTRIEMHDEGDLDVEVLPNTPFPGLHPANSPPQTQTVTVTGDDNVVPLIVVRNMGDTLTIHSPKGYHTSRSSVKVHVTTPYLESVTAFSSGNISVTGLDGLIFKATVNGSSDFLLKGSINRFEMTINGSGDVQAGELLAKDVKAAINGSGDAVVFVTNSLDVAINGSGDFNYLGHPLQVQQRVSGSGAIQAR